MAPGKLERRLSQYPGNLILSSRYTQLDWQDSPECAVYNGESVPLQHCLERLECLDRGCFLGRFCPRIFRPRHWYVRSRSLHDHVAQEFPVSQNALGVSVINTNKIA